MADPESHPDVLSGRADSIGPPAEENEQAIESSEEERSDSMNEDEGTAESNEEEGIAQSNEEEGPAETNGHVLNEGQEELRKLRQEEADVRRDLPAVQDALRLVRALVAKRPHPFEIIGCYLKNARDELFMVEHNMNEKLTILEEEKNEVSERMMNPGT